ncbi:hypothetical protein [Caballeronia arationis]|jgi:hypothetical protein|uniref:hypothetical protein n=1 Tax=Caballeronia arationis TaxID=1777142 RepID=UPI00117CE3C9|nr:hypothetical protein [Caballeronia arationis]
MNMKSFGSGRVGRGLGRSWPTLANTQRSRNCGFIGMTNRAKKFLPLFLHYPAQANDSAISACYRASSLTNC